MARETETSTLLGEALATSQTAVLLTSTARVIKAANAAAHALLGYSPSALVGLQVRALYAADDDYTTVNAAIQGQTATGPASAMRVTLRDFSGAQIDADVVMLPVRDATGKITSLIEFVSRSKPDTAAEAVTSDDDHANLLRFARGAAHDFKNLLAIITGNIELARDAKTSHLSQRFLDDGDRAAKDAVRIADQMISFARHQHIAPEAVTVADIFAEFAPLWQYSVCRGIGLAWSVTANLPPVFADRSGLANALLNLLINARDAIDDEDESGHIEISASIVETAFANAKEPRSYVAIAVRDTGAGMTQHVRARAFDPFFSTKSASHGRGLGLATVLGFARQANGHVTIESELGAGTTVTLFLPPA